MTQTNERDRMSDDVNSDSGWDVNHKALLFAAQDRIGELYATLPLSGDNERITLGMEVYYPVLGGWDKDIVVGMTPTSVEVHHSPEKCVSEKWYLFSSEVFVKNPEEKEG